MCPCPTLQVRPLGRPHMARGQDGSLLLSCMTLSFTTSRRFIPTLSLLLYLLSLSEQTGFSPSPRERLLPGFRRFGHPPRRRISLQCQLGNLHRQGFHLLDQQLASLHYPANLCPIWHAVAKERILELAEPILRCFFSQNQAFSRRQGRDIQLGPRWAHQMRFLSHCWPIERSVEREKRPTDAVRLT